MVAGSMNLKTLKREDPIKFGELLCEFKAQGLNQTQIGQKISINRHMVGRYLRIGQWDQDIKEFIGGHRDRIKNTMMLRAASKPLSTAQLKKTLDIGEIAPLKTKVQPRIRRRERTKTENPRGWFAMLYYLVAPRSVFLLLGIGIFMSFLLYQGYLFFLAIDTNEISAIYCALLAELVPIAGAIGATVARNRLVKTLLVIGVIVSVCGLGAFIYTSLAKQIQAPSAEYLNQQVEREALLQSITSLTEAMKSTPASFVTKRQAIIEQMNGQRAALATLNATKIAAPEQSIGGIDIVLAYSVWLRISAMLMNAMMVHFWWEGMLRRQ